MLYKGELYFEYCTTFYYIIPFLFYFIIFADKTSYYVFNVIKYNFFIFFCSLLFVSTLDGKISALDVNNLGEKQWTLEFNEPMLSSNIHHREVSKY